LNKSYDKLLRAETNLNLGSLKFQKLSSNFQSSIINNSQVFVKAKNLLSGNEFFLSKNDFENRKFGMQEMYQDYMEEGDDWNKDEEVCGVQIKNEMHCL